MFTVMGITDAVPASPRKGFGISVQIDLWPVRPPPIRSLCGDQHGRDPEHGRSLPPSAHSRHSRKRTPLRAIPIRSSAPRLMSLMTSSLQFAKRRASASAPPTRGGMGTPAYRSYEVPDCKSIRLATAGESPGGPAHHSTSGTATRGAVAQHL